MVDYLDPKDEFAEVFVVLVREDSVEDTRSKAIDVQKQLPGFVTAQKLFSGISGGTTK